jgi:hypothetical protein
MTTARSELTKYLHSTLSNDEFNHIIILLDRSIQEGRYVGNADSPYIGYVSMPINCGTKRIILQRRSGGVIQWLLEDDVSDVHFRACAMTEKSQFDKLWDLLFNMVSRPTDGKPEKSEELG